jgi:hypothetical protein
VGLLLLVLPGRIWYLFKREKKVAAGNHLATFKIVRKSTYHHCPVLTCSVCNLIWKLC